MPTRSRSKLILRDAAYQNRLTARLRNAPPDRAFAAVKRMIACDPKIGLSIANRVLKQRHQLEELFLEGIQSSNESTSRFWIDSLGPRLGAVRTIQLVEQQARTNPAIAAKALYWLPSLVKNDPKAKSSLQRLREQLAHS